MQRNNLDKSLKRPEAKRIVWGKPARLLVGVLTITALAGCSQGDSATEGAEAYPDGALEYIVPYSPGGSTDPLGREFSRLLAEELGTSETVQNLPGGDEAIGISKVVNSEPDGQTMGLASSGGLVAQPLLHGSLPFEDPDDYLPVVRMVDSPYALFVKADSPYETLDDLVQAAEKNPGEIGVGLANRYANTGFTALYFEEQAGIDLTMVPFAGGSGESVVAVLGGEVEAMVATASGQLGMVEAGKMRALAHTGESSYNEYLPGAVSFDEAGYDVPFSADYMTIAPAGIPDEIKEKLTNAALEVANSDEWAQWCEEQGNVPAPLSGSELEAELEEKAEVLKRAIELADAEE